MSIQRRVTFCSTLPIFLSALLCGCFETASFSRTLSQTQEHVSGTPVRVTTENGSVSVRQSDRDDIEIQAHIRAISDERAERTSILAERDEQGLLSIRPQWPDDARRDNEGCSFDILLPGAEGIEIRTSNGRVETVGLTGEAELHSSNGPIEVRRHDGPVIARTSNGMIAVDDVSGYIDAQSSNGKIEVEGALGEVKTRTSNGHIRVDLAPSSPGPVQATTSNGSIRLGIGPAFAGTVELRTSNGALRVDELPGATFISSSKDRLELKLDDADHASLLRTSNGPIELQAVPSSE